MDCADHDDRLSFIEYWLLLHPASAMGCNSFDIVCVSVCVCVCVCVCVLPLSRPNGQTYGPDFWCVGQMEGYLGQVQRSRS